MKIEDKKINIPVVPCPLCFSKSTSVDPDNKQTKCLEVICGFQCETIYWNHLYCMVNGVINSEKSLREALIDNQNVFDSYIIIAKNIFKEKYNEINKLKNDIQELKNKLENNKINVKHEGEQVTGTA